MYNNKLFSILIYPLIFLGLLVLQIGYLKIADHFNVIDKPNERSSHSIITIRGGGIIFVFAGFIWYFAYGFQHSFAILGFFLMALISFLDDLFSLSHKIRILVQLVAVSFMFSDIAFFTLPWYIVAIGYIITIGWINAFNFMDGINGITPFYSLVALISFLWINQLIPFTSDELLIVLLLSVIIFSFFNARKKAKCFAGDVGSVSISFLLAWIMICLMLKTGKWEYILFFGVYGVDSVLTIMHRLLKRENIFKAHRSHLYQYLSNELNWPHVLVSILYALIQLELNIGLIILLKHNPHLSITYAVLSLFVITLIYVSLKSYIISKNKKNTFQ